MSLNIYYKHLHNDFPFHPNGLLLSEEWYGNHDIGFLDYGFWSLFRKANITVNFINEPSSNYIIPINLLHSPTRWYKDYPNALNKILLRLPLKDLIKGKAKLMLYDGHEGNHYKPHLSAMYKFYNKMGISPSNVIILSANYNIEEEVYEHAMANSIQDTFYAIHFNHHIIHMRQTLQSNNCQFLDSFNSDTKRTYDFLCMNRISKSHRTCLAVYLNMITSKLPSLVSFAGNDNTNCAIDNVRDITDKSFLKLIPTGYHKKIKEYSSNFIKTLPLVIDRDDFDTNFYDFSNLEPYQESYFNIVTETLYDKTPVFFTEKIWKPIINYQPFMIVSTPYMLKGLKNEGFLTYPSIFDESYDDLLNPVERMERIFQNIDRIKSWSPEKIHTKYLNIKETAIHNRTQFEKFDICRYILKINRKLEKYLSQNEKILRTSNSMYF